MSQSALEAKMAWQLRVASITPPVTEFRFHKKRLWRFDFAWPESLVALEVEGGTWTNGRHTRGTGFESDCEKYNEAAILGWCVLRATGTMVGRGLALRVVEKALNRRM